MGGNTKTSTLDAITRVLLSLCLRSKMETALAVSRKLSKTLAVKELMILVLSFLISLKCVSIHSTRGLQYIAIATVDLTMVVVVI